MTLKEAMMIIYILTMVVLIVITIYYDNRRIERKKGDEDCYLMWQYTNDPNDIDNAIKEHDENWEGLESLHQIKSITYDTNHGCYVVFWIAYRDQA